MRRDAKNKGKVMKRGQMGIVLKGKIALRKN